MEKQIHYKIETTGADSAYDKITALKKENIELRKSQGEVNKQFKEGAVVSDNVKKEYAKNEIQIKKNNKELTLLTKEIINNGNQNKQLRTQLLEARREMQRMAAAGDTQSKQYKELRNQAASYQDTLDRVNTEIKTFADDAMVINTVVDASKGLASGMQLVQSVTALAGVENEKLMEVLVKLQAAQGLVNGLQGVSNMLQKESRVLLMAKLGAQKLVTAAQWAWNAAMSANPIGIIITAVATLGAGIYALVKNFDAVTSSIEKAWNWLKFWKKDTDEVVDNTDNLTESNKRNKKSFDDKTSSMEFEIKLLKAMGAEQEQIINKERQLIQLRINQTKISLQAAEAAGRFGAKQAEELRKRLDGYEKDLLLFEATEQRKNDIEEDKRKDRINKYNQEIDDKNKREELAAAQLKVVQEQNLDNELQLLEIQKQQKLDNDNLTVSERLLIEQDFYNKKLELEEEYRDRTDEIEAERLILEEEKEQERLEKLREDFEQYIEVEQSEFDQRLEMYNQWLNNKAISEEEYNNLIKSLRDDEFEHYKKINEEKAKSDNQFQQAKLKAEMDLMFALTDVMGVMAGNSKELFLFQQGLALSEAFMSLSLGLAKSAQVGFPQNIATIASFIGQTSGIISNIKKSVAPKEPSMKKFADGGAIISGRSHSSGGVKFSSDHGHQFEVEGGEFIAVVNKRDSAYAQALSDINSRHGVDFGLNKNTSYFAAGGTFDVEANTNDMNMSDIVRNVVEQITSIPVKNVARETDDMARYVENIERSGDL